MDQGLGDQRSVNGAADSVYQAEVHSGLSIELAPASIKKRGLAYAVDLGLVYAMLSVFGFFVYLAVIVGAIGVSAGFAAGAGEGAGDAVPLMIIGIVILVFVVFFGFYHGYFIYQEAKHGRTIGKKLFGLTVVSVNGERLSIWQCVLRDMFRYVDVWLIFPGLLSMVLAPKKQRVGDFLAGTLVVASRYQENKQAFLYLTQDEYWRLHELLKPTAVPLEICKECCSYASRKFIAGQSTTAEADKYWVSTASSYFGNSSLQQFESDTILLFFAELCLKTLNK